MEDGGDREVEQKLNQAGGVPGGPLRASQKQDLCCPPRAMPQSSSQFSLEGNLKLFQQGEERGG